MDEIDARLRQTTENCIKAYDAWAKSKKNAEARSALLETLHELRKVSARLEIEMASSERDEMTQRQIPIPPHRSSRPRGGSGGADLPDFIAGDNNANDDDSIGNSLEGSESSSQPQQRQQRSGGGGGHGQNRMQHRRPMRPRPQDNGNE